MVHALQELWRVLATGGTLLDLRPLSSVRPIEVVSPEGVIQVGVVDESAGIPDDEAANRAIRQVVEVGRFVSRGEVKFETEHYWDTVKEMASFMETRRHRPDVRPSYGDVEAVYKDLSVGASGMARLRCRWLGLLAVYRKAI